MPSYFTGRGTDLGTVNKIPEATSFLDISSALCQPVILPLSRKEYAELPTDEARGRAKRVRFITPAVFKTSPSNRKTEFAAHCDLIFLDIDDPEEAKKLLAQDWMELIGDYSFMVWRTASSTPEKPRLRVMVGADKIPVSRYGDAVKTVAELLCLQNVTRESKVAVQPMYWPVMFSDDTETPVVITSNGDLFTQLDLIDAVPTIPDREEEQAAGDLDFITSRMDGVTVQDAEAALGFLDPDMKMDPWFEIGAGLKHQFSDEEAWGLFNTWSAKGSKYPGEEELRERWDTIKANPVGRKPVTIRTLFKMAKLAGYVNPTLEKFVFTEASQWITSTKRSVEELLDNGAKKIASCVGSIGVLERASLIQTLANTIKKRGGGNPVPLDAIRREVRKHEIEASKTMGVPPWAKGFCFVTSLNQFYQPKVDRRYSPEVLDLMYSTPQIGEEKPMRPRDYLMQRVGIPTVENLRYDPSRPDKIFFTEDSRPYCNTYRSPNVKSDPERAVAAGKIFQEHIANLIKEEEYQRTVIDFLAYHVQHPGKKVRWAVLLQGAQGCGKTAIAVAMTAVLGRRNVRKVNADSVMNSQHNDWAYGSQLVVLEEVRIMGSNRFAVMDKLKPCISDDEISLHRKFEHHQTVNNVSNYLMFTNHHDSLAIHDSDRRYFVLSSQLQTERDIQKMGGPAYFNRLFGMIRDNTGGFKAWLEQWRISPDFMPEGRAPVTEYMADLVEASATPLMNGVKNILEDCPHPLIRPDLVSAQMIQAHLEGKELQGYSSQAMASVLRELNWIKMGRFQIDGFKHQLWARRKLKNVREMAEKRMEYL